MSDSPTLIERGAQLNQAAEAVLARENVPEVELSDLSPIARLALASYIVQQWPVSSQKLGDHLAEAGLSRAQVGCLMRALSAPGDFEAQLAPHLASAGADPVRLRQMTLPEATSYLASFLVQLPKR